MAEKKQELITATTNTFGKSSLVTDLDSSYIGKELYTYARNIDNVTHEGNMGTRTNSMSNTFCVELPYDFIGSISLNNDRYVIFSGDGTNSEIGVLDERLCTYTKKVNDSCLNFKNDSPITGEARILENDDVLVYFRDDVSPPRRINLNKIPYTYTFKDDSCSTKIYTDRLACDEILLFPKISVPDIDLQKSNGGNLLDGTYAAAIAYTIDGQKYSDYYSITNRIHLYNNDGNAFHVKLSGLDREFKNFQLVILQNSKGTITAKILGEYSTAITDITVTDFDNASYISIPLSELVIVKNTFEKVGLISANSNYLILGDLTKTKELNYQLQALEIDVEYAVEQVAEDYYENSPEDISYYRDENYDFGIEWLDDLGKWRGKSHIPGRSKTGDDKALTTGTDVYELDEEFKDCDVKERYEKWEIENTAGEIKYSNKPFVCDRRVLGYGKMGYFESTELYPDNKELFGNISCTPIRYHKFPDECKVPRYSNVDGKIYINILGVRIKNIKAPVDSDGKLIPGIVGYRIVRSDRKGGNKTVIARGLATNVRYYKDLQTKKNIWYANYPYNDLRPDSFISSTQTVYKNKKETKFTPLTKYFEDKFNFYTPHAYFQPKYRMGGEFKIESEEIANVEGYFEPTFGHPTSKLLTQFAFWTGIAVGVIEAFFTATGERNRMTFTESGKLGGTEEMIIKGAEAGVTGGAISGVVTDKHLNTTTSGTSTSAAKSSALAATSQSAIDAIQGVISAIKGKGDSSGLIATLKALKDVLKFVVSFGATGILFTIEAMTYAENTLNIIRNFLGEVQYAYQYNSHALFNSSVCVLKENKRRRAIYQPEYLTSNLHTIRDTVFNNYGGQDSILVELNKPIDSPKTKDNSRRTMSEFGSCAIPELKVKSRAVAFYCTSKNNNKNQYGQLDSTNTVLTHSQVNYINNKDAKFTSPIIYGGDCVITKFAIQTKRQFFRQNLATTINNELPTNFVPNTPYNYRLYRNVGYPRYWIDTTEYDYSSLLTKNVINYSTFSRTTTSKYNLDCKFKDGENVFRVDNAHFYTSCNGVMEFYVECDHNISFREKTQHPFYSKKNTQLSDIFSAPKLWFDEEFKLNEAFKDLQTSEIFSKQIRLDFKEEDNLKLRNRNSIIYSLPSFNQQKIDNWRYFLPNNYFSFNQSDFGNLTGIHKIDQERLIYLFDRSSPFVSTGRDEIQTLDGRKVTVGDGGMFAKDPRELQPTDVNYGANSSKYAFSSNQFGYYYPSETQGRFFNFTGKLDDLSENGMYYWCKKYMPIQLYEVYKEMSREENPLTGVGYHLVFDNNYERIYLTKRDFLPKKEFISNITYNTVKNQFELNGVKIDLHSEYFDDVSWTLSYSPKDKGFVSWHDWHPDWIIQSDKHFLTVKKNSIYKHNQTCTSFCNYYGIDYPFQIEYVSSDGQNVETTKSLEYIIESYEYRNDCRDKYHLLNNNFDNLLVHNTEQCSPLYNLIEHPQTKYGSIEYPRKNNGRYDILYTKEENKYRINQFWDSVKDRGEFTLNKFHIWNNHPSGYKRIINPVVLDLDKPEKQRKKFRHYFTKFLFSKEKSENVQYVMKFFNNKNTRSIK